MPRHLELAQNVRSFFSEKLVQISLVSGVLFYIVANSATFSFVEQLLKQVFGVVGINVSLKGEKLLIFHSLVFAILMGITVKYIFTPLLNVIQNETDSGAYLGGVLEGLVDKEDYVDEPYANIDYQNIDHPSL
tara:strand:+ start:251 stop:649 length:399 start_codon:yes stop_codon:yes gene_type:complete